MQLTRRVRHRHGLKLPFGKVTFEVKWEVEASTPTLLCPHQQIYRFNKIENVDCIQISVFCERSEHSKVK